jgi:hypothetical protein
MVSFWGKNFPQYLPPPPQMKQAYGKQWDTAKKSNKIMT